MGDIRGLDMDTSTISKTFQGIREHFSGQRESTELSIAHVLRTSHPGFDVTCTAKSDYDLLGYAKAGYATASEIFGEAFDATRTYVSPSTRAGNDAPKLRDSIRCGSWRYTWEENEFLLYEVYYHAPFQAPKQICFVLSPRSDGVTGRMSPATDALLLAAGAWCAKLHNEIYVFDNGAWKKSKKLWNSVQGSSWDDVILNQDMKANLIKDVQGFFDNEKLYTNLAVPWKRGLILHGVPGNGKTISIKALINTLYTRPDPVSSLYIKSFTCCAGEKFAIGEIFKRARKMAPCLLILEDLDSLVRDKTRSYFLNEVDGLESNDGILMIGSTNHLDALDPAIAKRPSRFDRKYHFKLPNEAERSAYCQFWRKKLIDSDMVEFPEELCDIVAKLTEGFSFAYLKELFVISLLSVARGHTGEEDLVIVEEEKNDEKLELDSAGKAEDVKAEGNTAEKSEGTAAPEKKLTVPEVAIPESLKDNTLLQILRSQTKMLLEEMDNTGDSKGKAGKAAEKDGGDAQSNFFMQRAQEQNLFGVDGDDE
ncbi:hypothetical protein BP6252_03796 [Coleophoma cylindrospora]|uniref:AAA+ ATPase domain-containing protein n=1 Tax=Coleophoma cylindrospora TaxID=1849047 RepID=A0A3D8S9A2_9HELO|nr:hypothetical protein BP6252_03796 [Coleophoma cylindrospora]